MGTPLLEHFSEADIGHELRGFPDRAIKAVIQLKQTPNAESLVQAVPEILAFYLPSGVSKDLAMQPTSARLREDLGVDSLTFAEAAYKMEELFRIRVENAELAEIKTLGELQAFFDRKLLAEA